jgi:hypothetical protein
MNFKRPAFLDLMGRAAIPYFALSALGYAQLLPGEVLPVLKNVEVDTSIIFSTGDIFTYSYIIVNPASNSGKIEAVKIDISRATGTVALASEGITSDNSAIETTVNRSSVIPVGFRSPSKWIAAASDDQTARWGAIAAESQIAPGKMQGNFILQTRGLPGVRTVTLQPEFIQTHVDEASEEDVVRLKSIEEQTKFNTITIGPDAPKSLEPTLLIDRLSALTHQAVSLGWIFGPGSDGIANSLDAKLASAKDSVSRGNNTAAKKQLNALINDLDAQRGKHVNDNAYFLLKTNAQFIISKLQP